MNTAILRSRILDLAIRGQLVPQDPNEGTADDLLKAIAAQRGKPVTPITDNVPFDIPANWRWVKLGDITINRDSERIPISSIIRNKQSNRIYDYYGATGPVDKVNDYIFDERLLLIGEDGANLLSRSKNNAFFAEGKYWVNNHAHILDCEEKTILDYIAFYINSISLEEYVTGSAQPKLSQGKMNIIPLPLPPLAEQHRIVAKVEELLSEVDKIEQAQADITQAATILRSRVLDSALKGELTHSNTEEWENVKLGDVCSFQNGYAFDSHDYCTEGTPLIRIGDIKEGKVNFEKCVFVNKQVGDNFLVHKGDLLIAMSGASTGKIGIYEEEKKAYLNQRVGNIKIEDNSKIIPQYRNFFLQSQSDIIYKLAYGGAQPNISGKMILGLSIPLPPLAEQKRIVAKIEQLFTEIDKLV